MKLLLFPAVIVTFCCSCGYLGPAQENPVTRDSLSVAASDIAPRNFFDSLEAGMELTPTQMQRHIPNLASESSFAGSSVKFPTDKPYAIAILTEDDQEVCLNQYLVLIDKATLVSTDSRLVRNECDIDYGRNANELNYELPNDSVLVVTETAYTAADIDDDITPADSTITTWAFSPEGKMIKQKEVKR